MEKTRINKYLSEVGYCSRRAADKLLAEGRIKINGKIPELGTKISDEDIVEVDGKPIRDTEEKPIYIAFNKPVGIVSTTDTQEAHNIVDYISHEQRIFPIGRLDKDSQGLILLTNDGDIVNKILRVGNNHKKEYLVKVDRPITKEFLTKMAQGVPILDRVTRRCEITEINPYTFQISLVQGLNRQIRRMCEYFDYEVVKLERIQIMNIKLGSLGQGSSRNLTASELEGLFDLLDKSESVAQSKKPTNSNKAMNKALEMYDIQHDHRKANSVYNFSKTSKQDKSPAKFTEEAPKEKHSKKKAGSGLRVGKSRVSPKKAQANQRSQPKRGK